MKKILIGILTIFLGFFVCSCASVKYYFVVGTTGEINYGVEVSLNEVELNSKPKISDAQIKTNALEVRDYILNMFSNQKLQYDTIFSSGLVERKNFLITIANNYDVGDWILKFNIKFYSQEDYQTGIAILKEWRKLNDYENDETTSKTSTEKSFLTIKKITTDKSVFSNELLNGTMFENDWFKNNFNPLGDVSFTQVLATKDKSLHSNASQIQFQNGIYYHIWNLNASEAKYANIKTYHTYPNVSGWYIIAFAIVAVFFIWYCVYAAYKAPTKFKPKPKLIKNKKNKK